MKTFFAGIAVVATLLLASPAQAQSSGSWASTGTYRPHETLFILNWEVSEPIGDFNKYIDEVSFRGFSTEFRSFVNEHLSAGLSFSFNRYHQTIDKLTTPIVGGVATGPVFRYADEFAIRALAHYYLGKGPLLPYFGAGIGGVWAYNYQQVADLSRSDNSFDFIVSPELGLLYNIATGSTNVGINVAVRYTYTTADINTGANKYKDLQAFSGILGLAWSY